MFGRALTILLCVVVAGGAAVRCYGLSAKSLWLDEAMSWQMQRFPAREIVERCAESAGTHPPLYFVLLHFWTRLFGESEAAMRSLAALAGIATIPAVYAMTRALLLFPRMDSRVVSPQRASLAGLVAASLVAFSPLHIHLSQQVRGYSLAVLLLVAATIALLSALGARAGRAESKRSSSALPRLRVGLMWSMFVACALSTAYLNHLATVSIAILCAFAVVYVLAKTRNAGTRDGARPTPGGAAGGTPAPQSANAGGTPAPQWGLATALALLVVGYLPWAPHLFSQSEAMRHSWSYQKTVNASADTLLGALVSTPVERLESQGLIAWLTVAGVAAVLFVQCRSKSWGGKYLAAAGTLPAIFLIAFSMTSSRAIIESRYLVFAQLHWLCAAAATVAACRGTLVRAVAGMMLTTFSIGACADCWPELGPSSKPDMRGAAAHIREHRRSGEVVVARGTNVFFELSYYLRDGAPPLLAVAEQTRDAMFGVEHLADNELITFAELAARRPAGLWSVDSATFAGVASKNTAEPPPRQWRAVNQRSFASDYNFEQPIVVSYLRPRSSEGRP